VQKQARRLPRPTGPSEFPRKQLENAYSIFNDFVKLVFQRAMSIMSTHLKESVD
jgi:hypothetical protein